MIYPVSLIPVKLLFFILPEMRLWLNIVPFMFPYSDPARARKQVSRLFIIFQKRFQIFR